MENRLYLSVMTVAASTGDLELTLNTYDASINTTIVANITGISSGDTEVTVAKKIFDQAKIIIAQYGGTYSGMPSLIQDGPQATFRLTRTEHCICFYSEAQFSLEVTNDEVGSILIIDTDPVLGTNQDALTFGGLLGQDYSSMTPTQIAQLLLMASSELIVYIRNPIVASTYMFQNWGNWEESVQLPMIPIISVDPPFIRRPNLLAFLSEPAGSDPLNCYDIDAKTGWIAYRFAQDVFNAYEPYDDNNDWRLTYVAGEKNIPALIKKALVLLAGYITDGSFEGVETLQGGTFKVGYSSSKDRLSLILLPLKPYIIYA